ncbi:MAG: TRAM domain-containing protein [Nitrososphaerales archaeon]
MSYGNRSGYGRGSYGNNRDRGFGGSSMNQGPKPVEAGKEYDVEITELSRRGDGVAKMQGFVIFVKGAKLGEKVKIKVETVGPRFATATALEASVEKTGEDNAASSSGSSDASVAEPVN